MDNYLVYVESSSGTILKKLIGIFNEYKLYELTQDVTHKDCHLRIGDKILEVKNKFYIINLGNGYKKSPFANFYGTCEEAVNWFVTMKIDGYEEKNFICYADETHFFSQYLHLSIYTAPLIHRCHYYGILDPV